MFTGAQFESELFMDNLIRIVNLPKNTQYKLYKLTLLYAVGGNYQVLYTKTNIND